MAKQQHHQPEWVTLIQTSGEVGWVAKRREMINNLQWIFNSILRGVTRWDQRKHIKKNEGSAQV